MDKELLKLTALGVFSVGFGIYTLIVRMKAPHKFGKLEAMKKFWGPRRGTIVHIVGYTVFPLVLGSLFLVLALIRIL